MSHRSDHTVSASSEFLRHGILPFKGREEELNRIISFWRSTVHVPQLQCLLLTGEGGIGKTRLFGEAAERIPAQGGAAIHLRLYPDSATSLLPLAAHAIWNSPIGQRLFRQCPDPTLPSVAAALRRISALRPTLICIDDTHLLGTESLNEMVSLLDAISESPISLLCTARSLEKPIRGVLERFVVGEIPLRGLGGKEIRELWWEVFAANLPDEETEAIRRETSGNPLAIRSTLHGSVASGTLALNPADGRWHVAVSTEAFSEEIIRHVELLSVGMTAHLNAEEEETARLFSLLGELFSLEAARVLLPGAEAMIAKLREKGILTISSVTRPSLSGSYSRHQLICFTHTLAHRRLLQANDRNPISLLPLLSHSPPLYSLLPFKSAFGQLHHTIALQHQTEEGEENKASEEHTAGETVRKAILFTINTAIALDGTPDWHLGEELARMVELYFERSLPTYLRGDRSGKEREIRALLLHYRLGLLRRNIASPEYGAVMEEFLRLTENPESEAVAELRVHALRRAEWQQGQVGEQRTSASQPIRFEEVTSLVRQFPSLKRNTSYTLYLRDVANLAAAGPSIEIGREVERRMWEIVAGREIDQHFRERTLADIGTNILWVFETPDELESRLSLIKELEANRFVDPLIFGVWKLFFLESIGAFTKATEVAERIIPRLKELGYMQTAIRCTIAELCMKAGAGISFEEIARECERVVEESPEEMRAFLLKEHNGWATRYALFSGNDSIARELARNDEHYQALPVYARLLLRKESLNDLPTELIDELRADTSSPLLSATTIAATVEGNDNERRRNEDRLIALLSTPVLRVDDAMIFRAAFAILFRNDSPILSQRLHDALRKRTLDTLHWLETQHLIPFIEPIISDCGRVLLEKERSDWSSRRIEKPLPLISLNGSGKDEKEHVRIAVIGRIAISLPNGEQTMLRNGRLRLLLGAMAADAILRTPLSYTEFQRILALNDDNSNRIRKGINLAVHRLRELMGHQAIITEGTTPRLNLHVVQIDLMETWQLLDDAEQGIRRGTPVKSVQAIVTLHDILESNVLFPGLFDTFFEGMRDEFDARTRTATLTTARALLLEEDLETVELILRRSRQVLPGDDEVVELLHETLQRQGKYVDAARLETALNEE